MNIFLLLLSTLLQTAFGAMESIEGTKWKIESYVMADGIGAWADDEAKPLIKKTILFTDKGITIDDKFCAGKITKVSTAQSKSLTSDLIEDFCGKGKILEEVYDIGYSCNDKIRFTPYVAKLSNDKYLGFGDGIKFCLSK